MELLIHSAGKSYSGGSIQVSNYPIWWDTALTIYNRFEDPQTQVVTWYRAIVTGCFWKYAGNKINLNNATLETNNIICRIPKDKRFLERQDWVQKPNDQMEDYFTLSVGDIIVKGEVEDVINEYASGRRSNDLIKKYKSLQGCMEIQQCTINTGVGRNNEHYYVTGI